MWFFFFFFFVYKNWPVKRVKRNVGRGGRQTMHGRQLDVNSVSAGFLSQYDGNLARVRQAFFEYDYSTRKLGASSGISWCTSRPWDWFAGRIIGSAEALPILCARCARWESWERERERERDTERERERERERRRWRHHCRAKIGDKFTLSLAKNSHKWRWFYTFPCQKFALFVSPFTLPVSPFLKF